MTTFPLPPRLLVPLAPPDARDACLPPGTRVNRGDALLQSGTDGSLMAFSPAAGTVGKTTSVERLGVGRATAVEIEVDASQPEETRTDRTLTPPIDLPGFITQLHRTGVQADRHTSPDLLGQLHQASNGQGSKKIDTILCSLLDPTSESEHSASVMRAWGDAIVSGVTALAKACGSDARALLAADTRAASAASASLRKAATAAKIVKVIDLPNDYPQADPTLLIYALLRRRLRPGTLPPAVGVILVDGLAAAAIGRSVSRGRPILDVTIEIRESDREACSVRTVPVGTPLRYVLEQLWLKPDRITLRAGAALRDVRVVTDAVIDGVGEVSIDVGPVSPPINSDPCIRCGWCVEACPVRIHPAGLLEAAQDSDIASAQWYGLHACVECGICSYVCPSRLPLLPAIRELRTEVARKTRG